MKKLFLFLVISILAFCFAACGDETAQTGNQYQQQTGTVMKRNSMARQPRTILRPTVKKKIKLPPVNIQTWPMVATGQTQCFNSISEIDCDEAAASGYGDQDGKKRHGTRSLNRSGNEIVRDTATSRLWTKNIKTDVSWAEAKNYCDNLKLENKTWRLPTTAELRSLINYGKTEPAVDSVFYDSDDQKEQLKNWFWATSHAHFNSDNDGAGVSDEDKIYAAAWIINFRDGFVEYTSRYNKYNVRCVSSEF